MGVIVDEVEGEDDENSNNRSSYHRSSSSDEDSFDDKIERFGDERNDDRLNIFEARAREIPPDNVIIVDDDDDDPRSNNDSIYESSSAIHVATDMHHFGGDI